MPNWTNNVLTIFGPEADIKAFKLQAIGHSPWLTAEELKVDEPNPLNFHGLVPVPEEVLKAGYNSAGYNWEKDNWGCKWGACHTRILEEDVDRIIFDFDTAWSPPVEFMERAAKLWPTLTFILQYEELGMGFKGIAKAKGDKLEDHCITL